MPNSKVILITGCSSGFGLLAAARFAAQGHKVIATMRNLDKQGPLCNELATCSAKADIFQLDVTDLGSIQAVMKEIGAKYGTLDVLINNAGIAIGGTFEDLTQDEIRWVMETNFFGVQNVTRAAIPLMRPQKNGLIINISSVSGFYGSPAFGAYNASKWALEGFSESLYHELKFFGIKVALLEPGAYKTKIFKENAHLSAKFTDSASPYYPLSQFLKKRVDEGLDENYRDPADVVRVLERIIISKNPKFRYQTEIEGKLMGLLKRLLPFGLFSALYRRTLFKKFPKRL